jgi:DNA polymerase/3'-5' exonuclease PolX
MKNRLIAVALLMAAPLYAQDFSNMDQAQIEGFMKQAQAMQVCMADIDQQELDALRVEGEKMASDIQALCKAGKRDEAQATAITYGKQMVNEPVMQELKECAGMASMMIPQTMWAELENEDTQAHVCNAN